MGVNSIGELFNRAGTYKQLLKTNQWQRFSKAMREQSANQCQSCKSVNVELHTHHLFYDKNRKPWEYTRDEVVVLCSTCHLRIHEQLRQFRRFVFQHFSPEAFRVLNGALVVGLTENDSMDFAKAIAELACSPGAIRKFKEAWDANH